MKKVLAVLLTVVLASGLLAACGGSSAASSEAPAQEASKEEAAPAEEEAPAEEAAPAEEPAEEAAAPAEVINMKLATVGNPGDGIIAGCEYFAENIGPATNGAIEVEVFPSSQLGGYTDYISGLQMGSLQVAEIDSMVLSTVDPKFSVFGLPYISAKAGSMQDILKSGAADILNESLRDAAGLMVIGWICRPARSVYSSKGPIEKVEDFEGLKIRTMESAPMLRAMELLGAKATPIPTAERYLALQTHVVDAAENNMVEIYNTKEYEVTGYLSLTEHLMQPTCICISTAMFDSLSPELQAKVLEIGEAAGDAGTAKDAELVTIARTELEKVGMKINEIEDKTPFMEKVAPLYEEYYDVVGEDLIKTFQGE